MRVNIVSTTALQNWCWSTPFDEGIGGSEVCHIELALRLEQKGHEVYSFCPLPPNKLGVKKNWHSNKLLNNAADLDGIVINFRDASFFDCKKPKGASWWYVAQDCDYPWKPEALAQVDRYICLCKEHAKHTLALHSYDKTLPERLFISTNGVRSSYLEGHEKKERLLCDIFKQRYINTRKKNHFIYASSPDRGLKFLLQEWWRIRERIPDAELRVAYGFNNMEVIAKAFKDWRANYQKDLESLLKQDGVTWLGRLPQDELYEEWLSANLWLYPSDWPETSCVTCMDAQACGAVPVTTNYWALEPNVQWGWKLNGLPQRSDLLKHQWLDLLFTAYEASQKPGFETYRRQMMRWARREFDWDKVMGQYESWITKDTK